MNALDEYGYDVTGLVRRGMVHLAVGWDVEVASLVVVLSKRLGRNPLLVGASSVDKYCIVEELARRIVGGAAPGWLLSARVVAVDSGKLLSGAKFRGEFEERVQMVLCEAYLNRGTIILYFDELLVGASAGGFDLGFMLKLPLAEGRVQCIAATMPENLDYLRGSGALIRQFQVVRVGA